MAFPTVAERSRQTFGTAAGSQEISMPSSVSSTEVYTGALQDHGQDGPTWCSGYARETLGGEHSFTPETHHDNMTSVAEMKAYGEALMKALDDIYDAGAFAQLVMADMTQAQSLEQSTLSGDTTITAAAMDQAQALDVVSLVEHAQLAPGEMTQAQLLEAIALTQAHQIGPNAVDQAQTLDGATLTQAHQIGPNAVDQAQALDGATLTQAQAVEAVALTQAHVLVLDDSTQAQLLDGVTFNHAVGWLDGTVVVVAALDGAAGQPRLREADH